MAIGESIRASKPKNPPIASKYGINKMKLSMHAIEGFLAARVSLVRAVFFDLIFALTPPVRIHVPLQASLRITVALAHGP